MTAEGNSGPEGLACGDSDRWYGLAATLRTQIKNGELAPGTYAPPVTVLVDSARAKSRSARARALQAMVDEGLLVHHPGLGYYVPHPPEDR